MKRRKNRSDAEIKLDNEQYLMKTRRWGNISGYTYNTVREAAYLLDVTPAEVLRQIQAGERRAWRSKEYCRGALVVCNNDIDIVHYPPWEPKRWRV